LLRRGAKGKKVKKKQTPLLFLGGGAEESAVAGVVKGRGWENAKSLS
jgi:hypothetical protein